MTLRTIVLVPTELERAELARHWKASGDIDVLERVFVCGFGPVVAAARAAALIERNRPSKVVLVGIAGALSTRVKIGGAYTFSNVACYGIGAGQGDRFVSAQALGFSQWASEPRISDQVDLAVQGGVDSGLQLLTTFSASASPAEVECKLRAFSNADAEDMEGFAVAAACRLAGVRLTIVRGISNLAGDREKSNWQIACSLQAAAATASEFFCESAE